MENFGLRKGEKSYARRSAGTLITENEGEKTAGFVVMSGKANMNPVIVALKQDGNKVIAKAYAKEGLIKQHTAEKVWKEYWMFWDEGKSDKYGKKKKTNCVFNSHDRVVYN